MWSWDNPVISCASYSASVNVAESLSADVFPTLTLCNSKAMEEFHWKWCEIYRYVILEILQTVIFWTFGFYNFLSGFTCMLSGHPFDDVFLFKLSTKCTIYTWTFKWHAIISQESPVPFWDFLVIRHFLKRILIMMLMTIQRHSATCSS